MLQWIYIPLAFKRKRHFPGSCLCIVSTQIPSTHQMRQYAWIKPHPQFFCQKGDFSKFRFSHCLPCQVYIKNTDSPREVEVIALYILSRTASLKHLEFCSLPALSQHKLRTYPCMCMHLTWRSYSWERHTACANTHLLLKTPFTEISMISLLHNNL